MRSPIEQKLLDALVAVTETLAARENEEDPFEMPSPELQAAQSLIEQRQEEES